NHRALTGSVLTPSGKGVQGAEISFAGPGGDLTTTTDHGGAYGVILSADTYNVKVVNLPGSDQSAKVSQCSGKISGAECTVDLSCCDEKASFTEGGVTVDEVQAPGGEPASGLLGGGTPIVIKGSGFGAPGSSDQVNLVPVNNEVGGDEPIPADNVVVVDDSTIRAVTRDATAQMGSVNKLLTDVEVTARGLTSPANPPGDDFTYERPVVQGVNPPMAAPAGRTQLTITGAGFGGPQDWVAVKFCPAGSQSATAEGCQYGFDDRSNTSFHPLSDTTIKVDAPAWPIAGDGGIATVSVFVIVLTKESGEGTSSAPYEFNYEVAITAIDLPSAAPGGGTPLTITGHGFGPPSAGAFVYFCPEGSDPTKDGKDCLLGVDQEDSISLHPLSDTTIKIAAPRWPITGDGGSAPVSVFFVARAQGHETFSAPYPFTYSVAIKAIDLPSASPGGGTPLTITGHGFGVPSDDAFVYFCPEGSDPAQEAKGCLLGENQEGGIDLHPLSDTTIKVSAPEWRIDGEVGSATVWVFFVATARGQDIFSPAYQFSYELAIKDIDMPSASPGGGTPLTITGDGFGIPKNLVFVEFCPEGEHPDTFGDQGCRQSADQESKSVTFHPRSDTTIKVVAPGWPIGSSSSPTVYVFVGVAPLGGFTTWSAPYQYTYK
ncbi:MAG TPA: IPT/TIG domain-containing protein, partial [Acidimicrobiales bacterium]|nr:IPT/TIG domain-containing protein [Acidimicrobiales bacterium]